jgi:antitoxin (DNA-binding transcriptional repressor) of toxin-antitoxin stability system
MKTTSIRELHIHTSKWVGEAADGSVIVIERRGEPVAELRPVTAPHRMAADKKARIFKSMRKLWNRMPQATDTAKILEDDRNR